MVSSACGSNSYPMTMTTMAALLSVLLLVISSTVEVSGFRGRVGGRTEVKDVKSNEEVQQLGLFSVEEYNRMQRQSCQGNGEVTFYQVVAAQTQVVAGIKYYLKIEARQHGITQVFDSVVVVKPWLHSKQLLNFGPTKDRILGF